jgi:hypothetical protein
MHPIFARTLALAATVAALAAAGCGGSGSGHSKKAAATRPAAMSVKQYLASISAITHPIDEANSRYFHGSTAAAAKRRNLQGVRAAYATAARRLAALRPPAAAVVKQGRLVALYRATAQQLGQVLGAHRFSSDRANSIAIAGHEQGGKLYGDLFTIPG